MTLTDDDDGITCSCTAVWKVTSFYTLSDSTTFTVYCEFFVFYKYMLKYNYYNCLSVKFIAPFLGINYNKVQINILTVVKKDNILFPLETQENSGATSREHLMCSVYL